MSAYNGSGVFTLTGPEYPAVAASLIQSAYRNALDSAIATGLSTAICRDGQSVITANIPFSGFKLTGIGAAAARTDAASLATIQDATGVYVAIVGGTANSITLTPTPSIAAYAAGQRFQFIASGTNSTTVVIDVSSLGNKLVTKHGTTSLVSGDILSGALVQITYDGTRFQLDYAIAMTQAEIGLTLYPQTAAELSAGVTPTAYQYAPGDVRRYGTNTTPGTTDMATALQSAVDQASQGGAPVYIPEGTFLIGSQIEIDVANGITIYGEGYNSCLKGTAAGTYIILLVSRTGSTVINGMRISNFRIDGNAGGQLSAGLIQANNCVGFVFDRLWIENGSRVSGGDGVNGLAVSAGTAGGIGPIGSITNCHLRNMSKGAINYTSESVSAIIQGNSIRDIAGNGTAPGIQVNGGFNARVIGNYIQNTEGPGIYFATDSLSNPARNAVIADNVVDTCGASSTTQGDGIRITSTSASVGRIVIEGNNVYDCGTNTNGGNGLYAINTDNLVVSGNIFRNNRFDGIRIEACNFVHISGNRCTGNNLAATSTASGIRVRNTCAHVSITSNNCSDDKGTKTQKYGIALESGATLTYLTIVDNHLEGNLTGPLLADSGANPCRINMIGERQTTNGSVATMQAFTIPDECAALLHMKSVGKKTDGTNRAIYSREGAFYRDAGGAATQQGATTTIGTDIESDATWGGSAMGVSGNTVIAQVQGLGATTIDWRADLLLIVTP